MQLLEFARKLRAEIDASVGGATRETPIGTLTLIQPYAERHYAEIEGVGTVEIDLTGNMIGFSPAERCMFKGVTTWIPTERCQNLRTSPFVIEKAASVGTGTASSGTRMRARTRAGKTAAA